MTIEERAKEYAQAYNPKESAIQWSIERAYGTAATEQQTIDIENAWNIFQELIDEAEGKGYCEMMYITKEQFQKAMIRNKI